MFHYIFSFIPSILFFVESQIWIPFFKFLSFSLSLFLISGNSCACKLSAFLRKIELNRCFFGGGESGAGGGGLDMHLIFEMWAEGEVGVGDGGFCVPH
jgi:hypothetical protein